MTEPKTNPVTVASGTAIPQPPSPPAGIADGANNAFLGMFSLAASRNPDVKMTQDQFNSAMAAQTENLKLGQRYYDLYETSMDYNLGLNIGNQILGLVASTFEFGLKYKQLQIADDYENHMYKLNNKKLDLDEKVLNMEYDMLLEKNSLVKELATIQAAVETHRIDADTNKSITNTKTLASYGYMNDKFYNHGKPTIASNLYI